MISESVDDDGNILSNCDQIRDYTVSYFESKFNGEELPIDEHEIISTEGSQRMDVIPTYDEIKAVVYDLDADSSPGPDGFSRCFYRDCWDVIQQDLYNAIIYCWKQQRIPNGILATRLGSVLDKLISEEQVAFMKVRNIHENISVASEMVNDLKTKRKDVNVGLKLDITQAFDTVSWSFISEVFRRSARISILLNGSPEGFFKINRGPRQGDPLSPLIFVLIEDVLSRNFTKLFLEKKMTPMLSKKVSTFPDRYLGVQIMPGAVKYRHISNVIDKIKKQLSVWKGKMLSFQDRVVLINSVIASYAIHNMAFYKWPRKFIMQCERVIRNFLWSGDSEVARKFVVGFDKVCSPVKEGGLSITSMAVTNGALPMKFWCSICYSNKKWARFLWAKYTTQTGRIKQYGVNSSIFPGVRLVHNILDRNTKVLLGDGRATFLYYDVWNGNECIADILGDNELDSIVMVSTFLSNNEWQLQGNHIKNLLRAGMDLNNLPTPQGGDDHRVWMPEMRGNFTVSSAKQLIRKKYNVLDVYGLLWSKVIHPNLAAQNWKLVREACATQDKIRIRCKVNLANKCYLCKSDEESLEHILWSCSFATGNGSQNKQFPDELYGITVGLEWALKWVVRKILVLSDSMGAVMAFTNSNMPWFARKRWRKIQESYDSIRFVHTYREANFATDAMAKRGYLLRNGEGLNYDERPYFLNSLEYPNVAYFRFK
ncbi:uncharacterized protein LOC113295580 [Papaver somniferum]|uniref:uncharacterized protein LOC113295580 n=1 Tax=Papaver somniferum TaxID=3469 RepID=UPI000E703F0B|nr:uncharacterized protein LOC113295580 [Papaver somniferum]